MEIKTQNIYGGSQQFADTIVNQYQNATFEQNDIELLKFIAELKSEEEKKQAIGADIATVNDANAAEEVKDTARSRVTQFLIDHKSEIGAWAGRIGKIALTAILAKFGLSLVDIGL
ncbi:MAG: hypothetical protein D3917_11345 [Candidatus Electrothrix sp. AX5]|nr:hypothetical protein [Candidatus Electrothrix sp. AX5]